MIEKIIQHAKPGLYSPEEVKLILLDHRESTTVIDYLVWAGLIAWLFLLAYTIITNWKFLKKDD